MKYYNPPPRRSFDDLNNYFQNLEDYLFEVDNRLLDIESRLDKILTPMHEITNGLVDPSPDLRNLASEVAKIKQAMGVMK